jgi:hypothetical protein
MTKINHETLELNGVEYIRKDSINTNAPAKSLDGMPYVVIRSRDSGCHAGYLAEEEGNTVTLYNSRRLWQWAGAATLSQLAMEGCSKDGSKFPTEVNEITVYDICEKIAATESARKSISKVPVWNA